MCPRCTERLTTSGTDWFRCTACRYEISTDAWQVYQGLLSELDTDPAAFFDRVRDRLAFLRSLEPAWQRTR